MCNLKDPFLWYMNIPGDERWIYFKTEKFGYIIFVINVFEKYFPTIIVQYKNL